MCGHDRLAIRVRSEIPLGRGLGSSAALAVAVAAAAGAADPLTVAAGFEGHAENAAASLRGGLVSAALLDTGPGRQAVPARSGARLRRPRPRPGARDERGAQGARRGRAPCRRRLQPLPHGPFARRVSPTAPCSTVEAGEDRLHQSQRSPLFPEAPELLARLTKAGALVSCWSGAGPSLLGICDGPEAAERVREAGEAALEALAVPGRAMVLVPDLEGLVLAH